MSIPSIQADIAVTNDCTKCCPRVCKMFCCFQKENEKIKKTYEQSLKKPYVPSSRAIESTAYFKKEEIVIEEKVVVEKPNLTPLQSSNIQ